MLSDRGTQPPAINWTPEKLDELRLAYQLAQQDTHDVFVFEGVNRDSPVQSGAADEMIIPV
jgi:hypothetical protein